MERFFAEFTSQIIATSLLEWVAVVLAMAYVLLAAKQSSWCWLCAFLSTAIYTWLFWQVTLPFQSALNFFYMIMAGYGYYQWAQGAEDGETKRVTHWPLLVHVAIVPAMILLAWGLSYLASSQFNSEHLLLDASINLLSVVTTFMVAHKILQNWVYWFFINIGSAYLYFQVGYVLSACLFMAYVGFSVFGYYQWRVQYKEQREHTAYNRTATQSA
ncbi:nicotinamide mononucleotide transporter [Alteromonas sp. KUL42]|uniref:nicotinamide riboside transporter PnuC n=1 Tax=Alteromonas sp. KUL42 TaxID=2480797 RepID=UPI001036EEE2|nr:nicotinamide riboside transporter PnuC [Alteromonas sp. KUL42]TAP37691.1 nicotinamide riboside transporter PnuC [Alteromonas sp. KUL42]GEA06125.1 nicotinamide mononucleotide transporter [Alteromonas sp. KUL42]